MGLEQKAIDPWNQGYKDVGRMLSYMKAVEINNSKAEEVIKTKLIEDAKSKYGFSDEQHKDYIRGVDKGIDINFGFSFH